MVHAINQQGREQYFSDRVWDMLPKHKNGWVKYEDRGEVLIPQQIVEFQQKRKEDAVVVEKSDSVERLASKDETKPETVVIKQPTTRKNNTGKTKLKPKKATKK